MVKLRFFFVFFFVAVFLPASFTLSQQAGSIRGMVYDDDFDVPLANAKVVITETGQTVTTKEEGNYVFGQVEPGTYTLVFSKEGYTRQVKADVVVSQGQMTEADASLSGEFTEMEEFVVREVQIGVGTEAALLELRIESPALLDSISADLMSQAGASDAASALKLVSGTTVQEGKYAVVRGLPDRYVNSQMNSVRLPTADPDKRAVQLDQFPSSVIESIQVSKTFTPDQQGDASGGAVNVKLKGIPDESIFKVSGSTSWNTKDPGGDFLSYRSGGLNTWGRDDGGRHIDSAVSDEADIWSGSVGVFRDDAPTNFKWSLALGDKYDLTDDITIGGFGTFFYERDHSYYDDGIDDKYWVPQGIPEQGLGLMEPKTSEVPGPGTYEDGFTTSLLDVTKGSQEVKWGGLGIVGLETENHSLSALYMYTRTTDDQATLAEDTRGKQSVYKYWSDTNKDGVEDEKDFYGAAYGWDKPYSPTDKTHPGNQEYEYVTGIYDPPWGPPIIQTDVAHGERAAPYVRYETLEYTERTTDTLQFSGTHTLPFPDLGIKNIFTFLNPELDWTIAHSSSGLYQPDKRFFASTWTPEWYFKDIDGNVGEEKEGGPYYNALTGGGPTTNEAWVTRLWKDIEEESDQYFMNVKFPFEQWTGNEGYLKFGIFNDEVTRTYWQESYSNFGDPIGVSSPLSWDELWSEIFASEGHPFEEQPIDVSYDGEQNISAWYYMADIPLTSYFNIIGGTRYESTKLDIVPDPDSGVYWLPEGTTIPTKLKEGDADVSFEQDDVLPAIGFELRPWEELTLRGSYTETIARQTFKELTPIQQQEYIGGDIFAGNPGLQMSALENYDLRLDYRPYQGGLASVSWFHKDITNPIEYVQRFGYVDFITPINFPEGELSGFEFELRQQMGRFWKVLEGLSLGANATFINSEVTVPESEKEKLEKVNAPMDKRDMMNAPEHLYNFFLTYNMDKLGLPDTDLGLFYTVRGDTLVAGPGPLPNGFIPSIYETEYGTLNLSLSHRFWDIWKLKFSAKNLLDPEIETVYRSKYIGDDISKTSYRKGIEFSVSLSAEF